MKVMQQKDELSQRWSSNAVRAHPLRGRVGVYIQASDTVDAIARIREAEQAGVEQAWMAMGGAGFADILTALAAVATQTEKIKLGTAIVPNYPRHPLVMAQQALAVHDLAPERLRLGIGSGNRSFLESRYGLSQTAPLRYLKEYLEVVRGVLWQGRIDFEWSLFSDNKPFCRGGQCVGLDGASGYEVECLPVESSFDQPSFSILRPLCIDKRG